MTADNVSAIALCNYSSTGVVNGLQASAFHSCVGHGGIPSAAFGDKQYFYLENGPYSQGQEQTPNNWTANETTYLQRVTIWTCAAAVTGGECFNNPVITTAP